MNRNDYRRAFIMLRAAQPGYGGHVRLERRTLTASMYFIVTAPQAVDALQAVLAGQRDGAYYAASLGELTRDRRGQLTLARSFDPRNIDGRPLEAYAWVVVARAGRPCAVVLTGNVDGSRPLDAAALRRAVEALLAPPRPPASDLPEPDEPSLEVPQADPPAPEAREELRPEAPADDIRIYTRMRQPAQKPAEVPENEAPDEVPAVAASEAAVGETVEEAAKATVEKAVETTVEKAVETTVGAPAEDAAEATVEASAEATAEEAAEATAEEAAGAITEVPALTAARQLGLDITQAWPAAAEPLRQLFATQAPAPNAPEDGFTYVRAPMPRQSGCAESLVGLAAQGGGITGLRYALPGRYAPEPPAGMEGYAWTGDGGTGYWVLDVPV